MSNLHTLMSTRQTRYTVNQVSRIDPTRTLTIRNKYVKDMNSRFIQLRAAIRKSIVDNDCFGLEPSTFAASNLTVNKSAKDNKVEPAPPKRFAFGSSTAKIDGFMDWLRQQESKGILEIQTKEQLGTAVQNVWANVYIKQAYGKGVQAAKRVLESAEKRLQQSDLPESITATMQGAVHADRAGLIYSRNYSELKGITDRMDTMITRVLTNGMIQGIGPKDLVDHLASVLDMSARRAETIARTEMMRAYHKATMQEYRNAGVAGVEIQAEFVTAGYNVCPICAALEGKVYTLDEAEDLIPVHPNCRCTTIPLIVEEETTKPKRKKRS